MKIAVIAHLKYPISEPFSGGLEMHTHLIVQKLSERGHDVTLYAAQGSLDGAVQICRATASLERDPTLALTVDSTERRAYAAIMQHLRESRFDLVHCNALHYLPLRESDTLPVPMVAVLHTPPFEPLDDAVRLAHEQVTFIAVSQSLKTQWQSICDDATVIDNGIDLTRFPFSPLADEPHFALWSGRIVPEKGLHLAIEAALAAKVMLKIAGPCIDLDYWEREIVPRLCDHAVYIGHLGQTALAAEIGRACVLVCTPRWEEPFGLVVAEALACGTPVAGFARGALADILDDSCGALVPADDVAALASAIHRCRLLKRRDCRARAEDLFDAEDMIDGYEKIYRRLVSHHHLAETTDRKELDGAGVV